MGARDVSYMQRYVRAKVCWAPIRHVSCMPAKVVWHALSCMRAKVTECQHAVASTLPLGLFPSHFVCLYEAVYECMRVCMIV